MREIELVLALVVLVAALATVARRLALPAPILMVLGGVALGAIPGTPHVELEPDTVFAVFLPPLLYVAAFYTSIRDFRANAGAIGSLAVGLVLATAAAVAVVAKLAVPSLSWPLAFALGAIVAPPDAVAATAVLQRLGAPRRVVAILEGESLLNDATALVAYRLALVALATGTFSVAEASVRFVVVAVGGAALGYAVGRIVAALRRRIGDPAVSISVSLVTPYAAYLPAEALGVSGVLATVVAGVYLGRHASSYMSSETRITSSAVWEMLVFLLTGTLFTLLGLQLPLIVTRLEGRSIAEVLTIALLVAGAAILTRFAWVYATTYLPRIARVRDPLAPGAVFVVGWAGMRGAVSLGAAFALPLDVGGGTFERDLLIFITFVVILVTLVGQGLTLPFVIRRLGVSSVEDVDHEEEHARVETAKAALATLEDMRERWAGHAELLEQLRARYEHRLEHSDAHHDETLGAGEQERLEHRAIRQELLEAERAAAREMHARGAIDDEVLRRIERDIDLEELRSED